MMRPDVTITTSMSSTKPGYNSDKAVDDNKGPDLETCNCCSETLNAPVSWWKVDMNKMYPVKEIRIYGRGKEALFNHLGGFDLMFSNSSTTEDFLVYSNFVLERSTTYTIQFLPNILTRFITIKRFGVLAVCEVEVIEGDCNIGSFGDQCLNKCHCLDRLPCIKDDGICQTPICDIGWSGAACDQTCPSGFFGLLCREMCHCAEGHTCTHDHGICPGACLPGFAGPQCNEKMNTTLSKEDMTLIKNNVLVIALASSCSFLLVVGVVISVIVYRKRKAKTPALAPTIISSDTYENPNLQVNSNSDNQYDTITPIPLEERPKSINYL